MQLDAAILVQSGYTKFPATVKGPACLAGYQRKVETLDGKTAYFINFFEWDIPDPFSPWSVDAQFTQGAQTFDVTLHVNQGTTVEQVEEFFANVYSKLGCIPDPHNN